MRPKNRLPLGIAALTLLLGTAAGCADSTTTPRYQPPPDALRSSHSYGATLLECPIGVTRSVSGLIGILGGVLELDGHTVLIPAGAVLSLTEFTLTVPASRYVEVDVTAAGYDSFQFLEPVALTVSYARCSRGDIERESLRIYHVESESRTILEDLGGTDDKEARAVTALTDHLSDYALGSPH